MRKIEIKVSAGAADISVTMNSDEFGNPDVFNGTIIMAGIHCHVTAIPVTLQEDGGLRATNSLDEESVESVLELVGDEARTTKIEGKDYLIVVYPYAK